MQKIKTTVHIAGKDYAISSYDSIEHVQGVAAWVDRRMKELHQATKLPGGQLAVLTAMNAADDMFKSREEIRRLRSQLEEAQKEIERLNRNAKA
jgi:cell division protein ZapA